MDWLILQLADASFPAGGFAHSGGLEAAVQQGEIAGLAGVSAFLRAALYQAGHGALPLVGAAHDAPARLASLDALCEAFLSNAVANRASRTQGRAFASTCERAFPRSAVQAIGDRIRRERLGPHYAPLFGAMLQALGVERAEAHALFLYLTCRGVLAAAVRLGAVGPHQAQRLQSEMRPELDRVLAACGRLGATDLAQTAPLVDLWQSTHDRLYSRLFQS
jgi:urease accessory protein